MPESEKFEYARQETLKLADGVEDPMGKKVRVIFDKENENVVNDAVKAFVSGHSKDGKTLFLNDRRAFATGLIPETIQKPDIIC